MTAGGAPGSDGAMTGRGVGTRPRRPPDPPHRSTPAPRGAPAASRAVLPPFKPAAPPAVIPAKAGIHGGDRSAPAARAARTSARSAPPDTGTAPTGPRGRGAARRRLAVGCVAGWPLVHFLPRSSLGRRDPATVWGDGGGSRAGRCPPAVGPGGAGGIEAAFHGAARGTRRPAAKADADRRAWQASMDAFQAEMRRLAERQAHVEGALSTAAAGQP